MDQTDDVAWDIVPSSVNFFINGFAKSKHFQLILTNHRENKNDTL